jgi:rhodanese-related sulfurtransferase
MAAFPRTTALLPWVLLALACPAFADGPAAPAAVASPTAVAAPAQGGQVAATPLISAAALEARLATAPADMTVLDVRTAEEFAAGHVPGARNIPVAELEARIAELAAARNRDLVVYCRTGRRALTALEILKANGFQRLLHLEGDMQGWSGSARRVEGMDHVDPAQQR